MPEYPDSIVNPPEDEDAEDGRDWGALLSRLTILAVVGGFLGFVAFLILVVVSAGQILFLFDRLR